MSEEAHHSVYAKDLLLLFPPYVVPWSPYLASPLLKAFLQQNGFSVDQADLSLKFFRSFVSQESIIDAQEALSKQSRCAKNSRYKRAISGIAAADASFAAANINEALHTFAVKETFFSERRYNWAIGVILKALSALSAQYFPEEFSLDGYRSAFSPFSVSDSIDYVKHESSLAFRRFYETELERLSLGSYRVIGVSVAFPDQMLPLWPLLSTLRSKAPNSLICLGGNILSRIGEQFRNFPELFDWMDAVVVGEGEFPLLKLLRQGHPSGIRGIVYREQNTVHYEANREFIRAKETPTPDFDGLSLTQYLSPEPVLPLLTFKGCSYGKCTFCDHFVNYATVSGRDGEQVAMDVSQLRKKWGAKKFTFVDEEMPPPHAMRVADALTDHGCDIKWMGYAIYRKEWSTTHWSSLAQSGCTELLFGFESASERVLNAMRKPLSLKHVVRITDELNRHRIASRVNVIVGFPGETKAEANSTLEFFLKNMRLFTSPGSFVAFHPFLLVRHAPLLNSPVGRSICKPEPEEPFRLHFDYDVKRSELLCDDALGEPLLNATDAFETAMRFSNQYASQVGHSPFPVWRVHRFLYEAYTLENIRPSEHMPAPSDHLTASHVTIVKDNLDFADTVKWAEDMEKSLDNYQYWSNFKSRRAHIETQQQKFEPEHDAEIVWAVAYFIGNSGDIVRVMQPLNETSRHAQNYAD